MTLQARLIATTVLLVATCGVVLAQPGWNWGDSIDIAKEKNALYTDNMRSGNYTGSQKPLEWLLKNTPDLNPSIYQNGAKIYESLAESATSDEEREKLQKRAMDMYDLRMKYFGDSAGVMNRKVNAAYGFYKNDRSKYKDLFEMFQKAVELNGSKLYDANLLWYMAVTHKYKKTSDDLSDEDVFDVYTRIMDIVDEKQKSGKKVDERIIENIDKLLTSTVDVDCTFVEEKLGPKFRAAKEIKLAKKIFALMLSQKCLDSPLAVEAAEYLHQNEPDYAIAKFIGGRYQKEGDLEAAKKYYEEAIELTQDNLKKADVYYSIALLQQSMGLKQSSRQSAKSALANDPSLSDAYNLIGNLYFTSYEDCKGGESRVKDRAVFLAAYEMYQKAGNSEMMAKSKEQFPSIEDIFNESLKEGDVIEVDCWINESVKLQRRP